MSRLDRNGNLDLSSPNIHLKDGVKNNTFRDSNSYPKSSNFSFSSSIFAFIFLILFVIAFSSYIRTGQFINFSFKSLIDYLSGMPDVSVTFASIDLTIYGDWGLFNFLKSFLNFFTGSFEVLITLTGFTTQALVVLFHLLGLFFI